MASSLCTVKIGAGAYAAVAGGIDVAPADVITIKLASSAGVDTGSWSITCVYTDETKVPATITALLSVNQTTFEATFTVPAGTGQALIFQSQVNNDATTRTTFGLYTLVNSLRCGAVNETYEGSATYGWVTKMNAAIRAAGGGGGSTPTGTGIPHVVAGVQDAAASLIVNGDVHASAAIALSKIVNPTGTGLVKASGGVFAAAAALLVNADVDPAAAIALSKLAGLGTGVETFLGTPSSANLRAALTDETGTGGAVFATSPTLTTPTLTTAQMTNPFINGQTQGATIAVAAMEIDWSLGPVQTKTLAAGANTFTFANQASGQVLVVRVTGAASTLTWPTIKWAGGAAPTQTASGIDVYTFVHDGTSIYGSVVQAMA